MASHCLSPMKGTAVNPHSTQHRLRSPPRVLPWSNQHFGNRGRWQQLQNPDKHLKVYVKKTLDLSNKKTQNEFSMFFLKKCIPRSSCPWVPLADLLAVVGWLSWLHSQTSDGRILVPWDLPSRSSITLSTIVGAGTNRSSFAVSMIRRAIWTAVSIPGLPDAWVCSLLLVKVSPCWWTVA